MRNVLFLLAGMLLFLAACKRNREDSQSTSVDPADAKAVSSAIRVWHGIRVNGQPPAPTNNPDAPRLEPSSGNQSIKAIAGRYAVLEPELVSGSVEGYYVGVKGAADYFKVDYSKPRKTGKILRRQKPGADGVLGRNSKGMRMLHTLAGINGTLDNSDSVIVVEIPPTIKPGEFCVTYCAYDAEGNVSNPITVCIEVNAFGGDASVGYLAGNWNIAATKEDTADWEELKLGVPDTTFTEAFCKNNQPTYDCSPAACTPLALPAYIDFYSKEQISFDSKGGLKYVSEGWYKDLDLEASTCSRFVFDKEEYAEIISGAWSYNAATQKLILIFEYEEDGEVFNDFSEFTLIKVSDSEIVLQDEDDYLIRLKK